MKGEELSATLIDSPSLIPPPDFRLFRRRRAGRKTQDSEPVTYSPNECFSSLKTAA